VVCELSESIEFMSNAAKILKNNLEKVRARIGTFMVQDVLVGIPQDEAKARQEDTPINNATIGYLMDKGMPERNVPARPWLQPGVESVIPRVVKQLEEGARRALSSDNSRSVAEALERAGLVAQNGVRAYINQGIGPELAAATLAARRRRGRTGEKQLVDTGQFRNSVTYVLRDKTRS
jgi:hypothetical protein